MDRYERQLEQVEREMRETLAKAREYTTRAAEEGRGLEDSERADVEKLMKAVDVLKEKRNEVTEAIETRKRIEDAGETMIVAPESGKAEDAAVPAHRRARSIGEAFVKSDGYKGLLDRGVAGRWSTGAVDIEGAVIKGGKALLSTAGTGAETAGGDLIVPDYLPGIQEILSERLTIADLVASGSTASNLVSYMKETLATNAAAGVAEGAEKPESSLEFDAATSAVKKIATWLPVTDEMIEDVPQLQSYINGRLSLFVAQEEEAQLLNGAGGNDLDGLMGQVPVANELLRSTVTAAQDADHVFRAISKVREAFVEPDAIVMHPEDFERVRLLKDGDERYMGPGPFFAPAAETLWGKRVVVTAAMTQGQALVGAFGSAAQIFRKGGISVEASNSHADYFVFNKTAIRAEERLAFVVYRPEAFATADLEGVGALT